MSIKRIICFVLLVALLTTQIAFAEAFRYNPRVIVEIPTRNQANDILLQEFTSVEPGNLPGGMYANSKSAAGYTTTALRDIGGGAKKNCLTLVDTLNDRSYTGPGVTITCPSTTGLVGIEVRYKFEQSDPENANTWTSFIFSPQGSAGRISRSFITSGEGKMLLNYDNEDYINYCDDVIKPEVWWTIKFVIDTNNKKVDVQVLNEATGKVYQTFDHNYYLNGSSKDVTGILIESQVWSGTWVIDYVRFTKESGRLEEVIADDNGKDKGKPYIPIAAPSSKAISGRTNIKVGNTYKYTTKAPKVENGNVLVTAKNVATIFDMAYIPSDDGIVIKGNAGQFVIANDGSEVTYGGEVLNLSAKGVKDGKDVFIPIKEIAEKIGYKYSYNTVTDTAEIVK